MYHQSRKYSLLCESVGETALSMDAVTSEQTPCAVFIEYTKNIAQGVSKGHLPPVIMLKYNIES